MASTRGKDALVPSARVFSKNITRSLLKGIYERAARDGRIPTPDEAIERMHELVAQLSGDENGTRASESFPVELARFDVARLYREAHHYAVDLFHAAIRPRKGAPAFQPAYLDHLLALRAKGLTAGQIAIRLGLDPSHRNVDRVRKTTRIAQAKGRKKSGSPFFPWNECLSISFHLCTRTFTRSPLTSRG